MRKKINENKKISTSKRREIKCRDNSPLPARYQSKHKRYFYLFVCLGVFISAIKLPRIPTYLLNMPRIRKAEIFLRIFYSALFVIFP